MFGFSYGMPPPLPPGATAGEREAWRAANDRALRWRGRVEAVLVYLGLVGAAAVIGWLR